MPVRRIDDDMDLQARRGDVVVCVRAHGSQMGGIDAYLQGVAAHTPAGVTILVSNDARDRIFDVTAPADVALLSAGTEVSAGWLDGLRSAAYSDGRVASASAIESGRLPEGLSVADAAKRVRSRSSHMRPRLAGPAGPCMYVRRSAVELAGDALDARFAHRSIEAGLSHVLADDVLVGCSGGGGYEPGATPGREDAAALARSLHRARRALQGLSVIIDARILARPMTGTQVHVLELIAALVRTGQVATTVLVADSIGDHAAGILEALPEVAVVRYGDAHRLERADVVHRPFQVDNPGDIAFLASVADRVVITQQDLIGYQNPSYFASRDAWEGYRELTRTALAVADRVLFFSAHARGEALEEELVEPGRAAVAALGVDHRIVGHASPPTAPAGASALADGIDVILCLGNDYRHKNRVFALRMLDELRTRHGWPGRLVLAGPHVEPGSSASEEQAFLRAHPVLAEAVLELGPVSETEKDWLLHRAALVLYPTVHEGFGLVPFEAAHHGVACMWAPGTSLSELLDDEAATLVAWDPVASAHRALELMREGPERARNVDAIRRAGDGLTWDATAARLLELYEQTCDAPAVAAGAIYRGGGLTNGALSEDAARLLGPGGALPPDIERPLLAVATHPRIASPLFGALKLGYRASHRLRQLRRASRGR